MSLTTTANSSYKPPKPGTYAADCIAIIDVGTMTGPFGSQQKIFIQWEIDETNASGERYTIGKLYTNSISKKAKLREHLEAWRGKKFADDELAGFDLKSILGAPCMLTIGNSEKDGRVYDTVLHVAKLPKGMQAIEPHRDLIIFDMDAPDPATLEKLPEWLVKQIEQAPEYKAPAAPVPDSSPSATFEDETHDYEDLESVPF